MTDKRMALVPREATNEVLRSLVISADATTSSIGREEVSITHLIEIYEAVVAAGKVSREQLEAAISSVLVVIFDDTRTNTDPDANATDATIAVITSLGLEIENE